MKKQNGSKFHTIDEYLATLSGEKKVLLEQLRNIIQEAAPEAEEVISYNMPAFRQDGMLVYFMAHKNHIGFYPGNKAVNEIFKAELKSFKTSKGTIQLPVNKALPKRLIQRIVKFRVNENIEKANLKKQGSKKI